MKRCIESISRDQGTLFPVHLEDWIHDENVVRVIDAFVDELNLADLGFGLAEATGRSGYHPSLLLKLYIYGDLNRIQSSRRQERETLRNVEMMWLLGRLSPDHKTIADFRKDNGRAIRKVCAQFVELCRQIGLLSVASVAIDGSKFKAVNNQDRNFTKAKMQRRPYRKLLGSDCEECHPLSRPVGQYGPAGTVAGQGRQKDQAEREDHQAA